MDTNIIITYNIANNSEEILMSAPYFYLLVGSLYLIYAVALLRG